MNSIEDFFDKYALDQFYTKQAPTTNHPIRPFLREKHKKLSHGIIPGFRNYDLFYERYLSAVDILMDTGIVKDNMKVLDVGAGEGFFKFFFDAKSNARISWRGIEIWEERAEFCEHVGYTIDRFNLEKGRLPYDDESFELVFASHVIEHIPNPGDIIRDLGRILKPAGILLVATPTKLPVVAQLDSLYHRISNRKTGETQQAFTHMRLQKLILNTLGLNKNALIDKRGFRILSGRKILPFENWRWFYRVNIFLGNRLLFLVPEVNIIVRK